VLELIIRDRMEGKPILLMAHIVLGYPSMETSLRTVEAMVDAGVDLMELQIPFSEPIADGPVILRANHVALENGATVSACLDAAAEAAKSFSVPFLIMSYYNVVFRYGMEPFVSNLAERRLRGAIIPDLPPEEGGAYFDAMHQSGLAPIVIFAPTTSVERMVHLTRFGKGFVYCAARKGVTGSHTDFSADLGAYLDRCRRATTLPLAVGFGVAEKEDVDFLQGKAEIAVVGTQSIRVMEAQGITGVKRFLQGLR
jgi:tryptophan synthase alpha chain